MPAVVEDRVADTNTYSFGWQVVSGPGDRIWFTGDTLGTVGSVGSTGRVSQFTLPAPASPAGIAVGSDGNLWYTGVLGGIGRVTPDGTMTVFAAPGARRGIVGGPDGNLWFGTEGGIGRISTEGAITRIPLQVTFNDGSTRSISAECRWLPVASARHDLHVAVRLAEPFDLEQAPRACPRPQGTRPASSYRVRP